MSERKFVPIIGEAHTDTTADFPRPMGATPRRRKNAVDEESLNGEATGEECTCKTSYGDDCPVHGPDSDRALDAAIAGNFDMLAEVNASNRELREQLKGYERANEGLRTERADLVAKLFRLEERLGRLVEDGLPAPTSIEAALEQLFDAEAAFAGAERDARMARCAKFDAQMARDLFEQQAVESLMESLSIKKTEAKERRLEHPRYLELEDAFRAAARTCDDLETNLRVAASRVETLRACVNAMAKHSALTSRASAIALTRTQQ